MKDVLVYLNQIEKVKEFVNRTAKFNSNEVSLDLISDRYVIDATSIMGIFSLDLSKNITLRIITEDKSIEKKVIETLKDFIV